MNTRCKLLMICSFLIIAGSNSRAEVYEASSLFNAVTRAETIQDIFFKRWEENRGQFSYALIDLYGKWIWDDNFKVRTYNRGSKSYDTTDMELNRSYGGLTIALPIFFADKTQHKTDWVIALNLTGYRYGLTRTVYLPGGAAGGTYAEDYTFTQFFDDIYAVSILWKSSIVFHNGIVVNNEYTPTYNGKIRFSDPDQSHITYFASIDLFQIFTYRMNINRHNFESFKTSVDLTKTAGYFYDVQNAYYPSAMFRYEYSSAYNDQPYDAVWVHSPKDDTVPYSNNSAKLNIASLQISQKIWDRFSAEGLYSVQYISDDIYSKTDNHKINPPVTKEWYLKLNCRVGTSNDKFRSDIFIGRSWYWDPAVSVQRNNHSKGNGIYGSVFGYICDFKYIGGEIKIKYNFSSDLKTLVETSDKYSMDFGFFLRIGL
jgi:hypothetical protein